MTLPYSLSRYLISNFLKWFVVVSGVTGTVFALFDLMELFRRASQKGDIAATLVIKMFLCRFPNFFQGVLPFIVLFSAIISFWRLNKSHELLIIRASGVSIWQILSPLVGVTLVLGVLNLLVFNPLSAKLLDKFHHLENQYIHKSRTPFTISKGGFWLREKVGGRQVILHATHFDSKEKKLYNVKAYVFDKQEQFIERFDAKQGVLGENSLQLKYGWYLLRDGFPEKFDVRQIDTTLSVTSIQDSFSDPRTLTFYTLRSYGNLLETSGLSATQYFMQWHSLLSRCFWLPIMVLLAATFSMGVMRSGGVARLIAGGITVTFLLYFLRDMTYALGGAGTLPPLLAAWVPTLVTAFFAVTKLLYAEDG